MGDSSPDNPDAQRRILTVEDIGRITEEERLRKELREAFDGNAKKESQSWLWKFVNSAFGLFLFSSVILAGITGLYTRLQAHLRDVEQRNLEVLRTTTELKYRLEQMKRYADQMKRAAPGNKSVASDFIWWVVRGGPENYRPSGPEFAGVTTCGLVSKLRLLGVEQRSSDAALQSVVWLENNNGKTADPPGRGTYPQDELDANLNALDGYADRVLIPLWSAKIPYCTRIWAMCQARANLGYFSHNSPGRIMPAFHDSAQAAHSISNRHPYLPHRRNC